MQTFYNEKLHELESRINEAKQEYGNKVMQSEERDVERKDHVLKEQQEMDTLAKSITLTRTTFEKQYGNDLKKLAL